MLACRLSNMMDRARRARAAWLIIG